MAPRSKVHRFSALSSLLSILYFSGTHRAGSVFSGLQAVDLCCGGAVPIHNNPGGSHDTAISMCRYYCLWLFAGSWFDK